MRYLPLVILLILWVPQAHGQSLWRDTGFGGRLFLDHRARNIGDTVTVILDETSAATQVANTKLDNSSDLSVGPGGGFLSFGPDGSTATTFTEADSFQGKGATDRSSTLTGMVSAQITDILPTGEYRIEGQKETVINDETQVMKISGNVRPESISLENTVISSYISDAKIAYVGVGPVGDSQAPGFITKMFNWLF